MAGQGRRQRATTPGEFHPDLDDLDALFELSLDLLCVADTDGYFRRVNPAFTRTLGYSLDELLARPFVEFVHPEDRAATLAETEQLARGIPTIHFENRYQCKSGEFKRLAWVCAPKGRVLYASARDVTEERRRRAEHDWLAGIVESSEDAIIGRSLEGAIISWNTGAQRIFGYTAEEAVGRTIFDLTPPERADEVRELVERMQRGEAVKNFETVRLAKDGKPIQVALTFSPILDASRQLVGASVIARDITARKLLEQRVQVADRLASLGTMAAGVAHEINNPLAAVISCLDLAQEDLPSGDPSVPGLLSDARQAAEKVRQIVRGLERMSRLEEGRVTVLDVNAVLDLASTLAMNEVRHRARLIKSYGRPPRVRADEPRLAHVFANLLLNAAQALPDGRAHENEIRIVTRAEGDDALVEIMDTGSGIAPEHLGRIFDPFFTTKPVGVGTGLGLPLCHAMVTAAGGSIDIDSEVGRGTTVRITLPGAAPARSASYISTEPPPVGVRGRVLIVDDDAMVGSSVRRSLMSEHDVVVCDRGQRALEHIAAGERFDVIVCDMMMPEMSGQELFAKLRELSPELAERVIFMSGGAFTAEARRFLEAVSNDRLDKPFEVAALRIAVRRQVARARSANGPESSGDT